MRYMINYSRDRYENSWRYFTMTYRNILDVGGRYDAWSQIPKSVFTERKIFPVLRRSNIRDFDFLIVLSNFADIVSMISVDTTL